MFSFGSDPELMLVDRGGVVRSAIPIVVSSPENYIEVDGHAIYHDNVNVEMTVKPGTTKPEVLNNFRDVFKTCADMVAPYRLVARASADFPPEEVEDPEAKRIACHPEFCAYEFRMLPKPVREFESNTFRTAGGHVHLGSDGGCLLDPYRAVFVVRCLDLFLGVPSLWMDRDPSSPRRREIYGLAGSHRPKVYGVEYRALSNFWVGSPTLVGAVFDVCEFAVDFVERGKHLQFWSFDQKAVDDGEDAADCIKPTGIDQEALRRAINSGNRSAAEPFLNVAQTFMPKGLYSDVAATFGRDESDFYAEWGL